MKDRLHARLEALAGQISRAREKFESHERWHDGHRLTAGELQDRYRCLKSELDDETADPEAHGAHVSALELSVRRWIDSLSLDTA